MKQILTIICVLFFGITSYAKEEPEPLYAQSAVLMDADSGRVLFEKNGNEEKAMASTTKIMTCILALEYGDLEEPVTVSEHAAKQPRVRLGMQKNEQFYLQDLLYSLMLESHNDSAVAIAEHLGSSVEGFADMMNKKAREIGCKETYFITPNGLDASDERGKHRTTAQELAKIMRYCIKESPKRELFLKITRTPGHAFSNVDGSRSFSANNHNAFLSMMEGALSGKTGFTGEAGYCYVGALEREGRTFIVALLGCGWPNNKGYKWKDTRKLMEYGLQNYTYQNVWEPQNFPKLVLKNGIPENGDLFGKASVERKVEGRAGELSLLLHQDEKITIDVDVQKELTAPLAVGEKVGNVTYYLDGEKIQSYPVVIVRGIKEKNYIWCLKRLLELYILK